MMIKWKKRIDALQALESEVLYARAAFSADIVRQIKEKKPFWLSYKEDVERIIHSKAFRRYSDKTQVVYLVENDHLTHRGLHVQLVSSYSRGVAKVLGLNIDLVEAISLGHDVGHPPFGHEGEGYLSAICEEMGLGAFSHSSQSCRLFRTIEPLNLSFAVYDGFLCHDGGMRQRMSCPEFDKSWDDHFSQIKARKKEPQKDLAPATLEGSLVKMCDSVSYLAKDIEDAIHLGIINRNEIPKTCLGRTNEEILQKAAIDLVEQSFEQDYIAFSDEVFQSLKKLRAFNFERIYNYPALKTESQKIKDSYRRLFDILVSDIHKGKKSELYLNFLHSKSKEYHETSSDLQKVVDYIAGMTDHYFVKTIERLLIPQTIVLGTTANVSRH